jgi:hypothetical protein
MVERVMILDAVLGDRRRWWLSPESDKRVFFDVTQQTGLRPEDYPHIAFGEAPRKTILCFSDKLPIGVKRTTRGRNDSVADYARARGRQRSDGSGAAVGA